MTDVAALNLSIDSSTVLKAANDLDKFSAAAARAGAASGAQSGSIAKIAAAVQSMDAKLSAVANSLDKIASVMRTAAASNDNMASSAAKAAKDVDKVARAFDNADSHVNAYRDHLQRLVSAQNGASASMATADSHVTAYRQHLQSLVTQLNAARAASSALGGASSGTPIGGASISATELQRYIAAIRAMGPANDNAAAKTLALSAAQEKFGQNTRTATANIRAQIEALRDLGASAGAGEGAGAGGAIASLRSAFGTLEAAANAAAAALRGVDAAGGGGAGGEGSGGGSSSRGSSSTYYGASGIEATGQAARLAAHEAQNLLYQLNDVFVSLASGQKPLMVFIQQGSQIGQIYAQAGLGVKGFGIALANTIGILKSTTAATEAAAFAQAQQSTASIAAANAQATAAVRAAETNIAVAQAQISMSTTAAEATAANARLTVATEALAAAQAEAAITSRALATSQASTAAASEAAAAATTTSLGAAGVAIVALLAVLLPLTAAIAALTSQANDDSGLKKYTTAMGYTKEEVKKLNAVTVTWGDTFKAVFQVGFERIASTLGVSANTIKDAWNSMLDALATGTRATIATLYAGFTGLGYQAKRVFDNIKAGKIETPLTTALESWKTAYGDAQKFMDDTVKQARSNAQKRQAEMAKGFYDKPSTPKGPHQYNFSDLLKEAQKMENSLTKAGAQIGLYGEDLARVTYQQDLLNKASEHGLKLTPKQIAQVNGLAAAMAKLSEANRHKQFMEEFNQQTIQQTAALDRQRGAIGLNGAELAAYTYETEQLNKALAAHISLTEADKQAIKDDARKVGDDQYKLTREQSRDANARTHAESIRQMDVERAGLGLTGEALIAYNRQQELINAELARGVLLKDIDIEKARKQGAAYAKVATDLARARELEDVKSRGLDSFNNGIADAIMGVKSLGSVFKDVANQIIADLLRIAIRRAITEPLGSALFGVGGGGSAFANGGTFGTAERFANGGTFTNSIVSNPTLFKFANGSKFGLMGEAGPEAIMPLKRGANGSLGVQVHGSSAARPVLQISTPINIMQSGSFTTQDAQAMALQAGEAVASEVRRNIAGYMAEWDANGTSVG